VTPTHTAQIHDRIAIRASVESLKINDQPANFSQGLYTLLGFAQPEEGMLAIAPNGMTYFLRLDQAVLTFILVVDQLYINDENLKVEVRPLSLSRGGQDTQSFTISSQRFNQGKFEFKVRLNLIHLRRILAPQPENPLERRFSLTFSLFSNEKQSQRFNYNFRLIDVEQTQLIPAPDQANRERPATETRSHTIVGTSTNTAASPLQRMLKLDAWAQMKWSQTEFPARQTPHPCLHANSEGKLKIRQTIDRRNLKAYLIEEAV
jgi:hypothetical protein